MSDKNNWFPISSPLVDSHFPCWLCVMPNEQVHYWRSLHDMKKCEPLWSCYTHWMQAGEANVPAAPKKEITRDELDEAELLKEFGHGNAMAEGREAWFAALSFERSEIRHLIKRHACGEIPAPELIREISKRVKL